MLKPLLIFILLASQAAVFSQEQSAPFEYHIQVKDGNGMPVKNQQVTVRIRIILDSLNGNTAYTETHDPYTDDTGLVSLTVGRGNVKSGSLASLDLPKPTYVNIAVAIDNGMAFKDMGTSRFMMTHSAAIEAARLDSLPDGTSTNWRPRENMGRFDIDLLKMATVKSRSARSAKKYPTFSEYQNDYFKNTGNWNTFSGFQAGASNSVGYQNAFYGYQAGFNNTQGSNNTFSGYRAGSNNTSGLGNTMVGAGSGFNNTTGHWNTLVGYGAGYANTTGFGNVFIGYNSGKAASDTNKLYIDNSTTATPLVFGDFDANVLKVNGDLVVTGKIIAAHGVGDANFEKLSASLLETVKEQKKTIAALVARVEKLEASRAR